jgi:hypothetical protein
MQLAGNGSRTAEHTYTLTASAAVLHHIPEGMTHSESLEAGCQLARSWLSAGSSNCGIVSTERRLERLPDGLERCSELDVSYYDRLAWTGYL